jgi:hypothetical protein
MGEIKHSIDCKDNRKFVYGKMVKIAKSSDHGIEPGFD